MAVDLSVSPASPRHSVLMHTLAQTLEGMVGDARRDGLIASGEVGLSGVGNSVMVRIRSARGDADIRWDVEGQNYVGLIDAVRAALWRLKPRPGRIKWRPRGVLRA